MEFRINEYLSLKLEGEKTVIYVNDEKFDQCPVEAERDKKAEGFHNQVWCLEHKDRITKYIDNCCNQI